MFDIRAFGAYIARLRKNMDLTQLKLSDRLNVTRQAVSKWEMGDSFHDIVLSGCSNCCVRIIQRLYFSPESTIRCRSLKYDE